MTPVPQDSTLASLGEHQAWCTTQAKSLFHGTHVTALLDTGLMSRLVWVACELLKWCTEVV